VVEAATALGEVGGKEALAPLFRALGGEDSVAQAAATALGGLGGRHYDELKLLIASRGFDGPEAPYLCRILGACRRSADVPLLCAALRGESAAVRCEAAEALGGYPPRFGEGEGARPGDPALEVDRALLIALADESPRVRAAAARALKVHHQRRAIEPLGAAARDGEGSVRAEATRALGAVARGAQGADRARAAEILRELADGADAVVALPAIEALGALGEREDDPRLLAALSAGEHEWVKVAAEVLGARAPGPLPAGALPLLSRTLEHARWDVRRAAAQALLAHAAAYPDARAALVARRSRETDPFVLGVLDMAAGVGGAEGGEPV
jgi:HEAT repeat protein